MLATDFRLLFARERVALVLSDQRSGSSVCVTLADELIHELASALCAVANAQQRQSADNAAAN